MNKVKPEAVSGFRNWGLEIICDLFIVLCDLFCHNFSFLRFISSRIREASS